MTATDAAKILDLPADASPEQLAARFHELRAKLEDKIAKAPTPGLKAKYRESLEEITTAFETLTLAADSSSLPVTSKQPAVTSERSANVGPPLAGVPAAPGAASSGPQTQNPRPPARKSGREFALVAIIAVVILAAGGWFVMKSRAENAEKARVAAEQKAEAERQAQLVKEQAERDRLAKEATITAEKERHEKLHTALRSRIAELNVTYDALMRSEASAERELAELKSQERDLARELKAGPTPDSRRLAAQMRAQDRYVAWLRETLPVHAAKIAKARLEEMLSARAVDDATKAMESYVAALDQLKADLATAKAGTAVTGMIKLQANVTGAAWRLTDGFGAIHQGTTPGQVANAGAGPVVVEFGYTTFPIQRTEGSLTAGGEAVFRSEFKESIVRIRATPAQTVVTPAGEIIDGWQVSRLGPGQHRFRLEAPGYAPVDRFVTLRNDDRVDIEVALDNRPAAILMAEATDLLPQATVVGAAIITHDIAIDHRHLWLAAAASVAGSDGFKSVLAQAFEQHAGQTWVPEKLSFSSSSFAKNRWWRGYVGIEISPAPDWVGDILSETNKLRQPMPPPPAKAAGPRTNTTNPLYEAVELILQGADPLGSGLRREDLAAQADEIVLLLALKGRTDLAYPWMKQANPAKGHHEARLRTRDWMGYLISSGYVDEAIALFEADNTRWTRADPTITYFVPTIPSNGAMMEMVRLARHRGDRAGLDKLAVLIRRLMAVPVAPTDTRIGGEEWRYAWLEPLQLAGFTTPESKLPEQVIAIADSTKSETNKPKPPRIPADAVAGAANAARAFTSEYGNGLDHQGRMFRLVRAKQLVALGQTEAAYREVRAANSSMGDMMKALAFTHASLGDWSAAVDAAERSARPPFDRDPSEWEAATRQSMAKQQQGYRTLLAQAFGLGVADRLDEKQVFAALRGVSDPLERVIAICTYILRRRELESMTPEQREFIRTLPPL